MLASDELASLYAASPTVAPVELAPVLSLLSLSKQGQLCAGKTHPVTQLISPDAEAVVLTGVPVLVPGRVYFAEPLPGVTLGLTARQRLVLHCMYLRHHDGFVRQRQLEQLLAEPAVAFTIPFTFSLIGDYVPEILEVLAANLTPALLTSYVAFIRENPRHWQRTQGRVASYWDIYYRGRHRGGFQFRHYVGARILANLQKALRQA